jgi:hypothetical protein
LDGSLGLQFLGLACRVAVTVKVEVVGAPIGKYQPTQLLWQDVLPHLDALTILIMSIATTFRFRNVPE